MLVVSVVPDVGGAVAAAVVYRGWAVVRLRGRRQCAGPRPQGPPFTAWFWRRASGVAPTTEASNYPKAQPEMSKRNDLEFLLELPKSELEHRKTAVERFEIRANRCLPRTETSPNARISSPKPTKRSWSANGADVQGTDRDA